MIIVLVIRISTQGSAFKVKLGIAGKFISWCKTVFMPQTKCTWQGPHHGFLLPQLDLGNEGPLQSARGEQGTLASPLQHPIEEDKRCLLAAVQQLARHVVLPCCVAVWQNLDLCTLACSQQCVKGLKWVEGKQEGSCYVQSVQELLNQSVTIS